MVICQFWISAVIHSENWLLHFKISASRGFFTVGSIGKTVPGPRGGKNLYHPDLEDNCGLIYKELVIISGSQHWRSDVLLAQNVNSICTSVHTVTALKPPPPFSKFEILWTGLVLPYSVLYWSANHSYSSVFHWVNQNCIHTMHKSRAVLLSPQFGFTRGWKTSFRSLVAY